MPQLDTTLRHGSIQEMARWFDYDHLKSPQKEFSQQFYDLAANLLNDLPDSPELTVCLRKLLEAKDCAVRCSLALQERDRRP